MKRKTYSVSSILDEDPEKQPKFEYWRYKPSNLSLRYEKGTKWYEVPLENCCTNKDILFWIGHVNEKTWATPEVIGELVKIIDATIGLRHSNEPISPREILAKKIVHGMDRGRSS